MTIPYKRPWRATTREEGIHIAICDHLRLRAKRGVLWLHVPNGEWRSKATAAKLKKMGVIAGASDLLLWHRGKFFALELKTDRGRASDAQLSFMAKFNEAGGHTAIAHGIDSALIALQGWGLI